MAAFNLGKLSLHELRFATILDQQLDKCADQRYNGAEDQNVGKLFSGQAAVQETLRIGMSVSDHDRVSALPHFSNLT